MCKQTTNLETTDIIDDVIDTILQSKKYMSLKKLCTQQIPEQKIYWKIFYHKFTDQVDHKFMENLTKNIQDKNIP